MPDNELSSEETNVLEQRVKKASFNEGRFWTIIAALFLTILNIKPIIYAIINRGFSIESIFKYIGADVVENIFPLFLIVIFPILFKQIFTLYPIEFIKNLPQENKSAPSRPETESKGPYQQQEANKEESSPVNHQILFIEESRNISEKIYNRAGVYLLLGCTIAFAGIGIFNSPLFTKTENAQGEPNLAITNAIALIKSLPPQKDSLTLSLSKAAKRAVIKNIENSASIQKDGTVEIEKKLIDYLPRFGALFLLEFIAFFFLRQYRIMLEEYRYYEAIKRKRQDNLVFLDILEKSDEKSETIKKSIVDYFSSSPIHKLSKEETTEVIETQKIMNQEMDVLGKITDLVKSIRGK